MLASGGVRDMLNDLEVKASLLRLTVLFKCSRPGFDKGLPKERPVRIEKAFSFPSTIAGGPYHFT